MKPSAIEYVNKIVLLSKDNSMLGLIELHDEMLKADIGIVTQALRFVRKYHDVDYHAFYGASMMSKVDKKGVFKKIVANAVKRESAVD